MMPLYCEKPLVYLATEPWSYGVSFGSQTPSLYLATEPWSYDVTFVLRNPLSI